MDDFIDQVAWGLNAVFSNGVGYPRTRWLVLDGARTSTRSRTSCASTRSPTQVWYSAYARADSAQHREQRAAARRAVGRRWRRTRRAAMAAAAVSSAGALELDDIQGLRRARLRLAARGALPAARDRRTAPPRAGWLGRVLPSRHARPSGRPAESAVNVALTAPGSRDSALPPGAAGSPARVRRRHDHPHRRAAARRRGDERARSAGSGAARARRRRRARCSCTRGTRPARRRSRPDRTGRARRRWARRAARLDDLDIGASSTSASATGSRSRRRGAVGTRAAGDGAVSPGEFVLGYPNEYGLYTDRPLVAAAGSGEPARRRRRGRGQRDLGRNGSYLVLRQLEQDVAGFWQFVERAAPTARRRRGAHASPPARRTLAERGAPGLAPDADDPRGTRQRLPLPRRGSGGLRCPLGAHVRRTNPRDSLDPEPGLGRVDRRRQAPPAAAPGPPTAPASSRTRCAPRPARRRRRAACTSSCLNANIARQFEFIHQTWLNSPKFGSLYDDPDPLSPPGARSDPRFAGAPPPDGRPAVRVGRGGAYLFCRACGPALPRRAGAA